MAQIEARTNYYPSMVPALPLQYRRLMDGQVLRIGTRQWRCVAGYGHAPEHMALACEEDRLLLGGDMMLPRISTNVSVFETEPEADALSLFLDSIDRFNAARIGLPVDDLALDHLGHIYRSTGRSSGRGSGGIGRQAHHGDGATDREGDDGHDRGSESEAFAQGSGSIHFLVLRVKWRGEADAAGIQGARHRVAGWRSGSAGN